MTKRARAAVKRAHLPDEPRPALYTLRLYVTGTTPGSLRAIRNLRKICEDRLAGNYELEVIDIYQQPDRARADQIIAAPTLVKSAPAPRRLIIGDLSERDRVFKALDIPLDAESP